jgi:hypothetical protein
MKTSSIVALALVFASTLDLQRQTESEIELINLQ